MNKELKYRLFHKSYTYGKYVYKEGATGTFHSNSHGSIYNYIYKNYTDIRSNYFNIPNSRRFLRNDVLEIFDCGENCYGYFIFDGNNFIYINNLIEILGRKNSEIDTLNIELEKIRNKLKTYQDKYKDEHLLRLKIERRSANLREGLEVYYLNPSGDALTCIIKKDNSNGILSVEEKSSEKFICNLKADWYISQPIFLNLDDLDNNKEMWTKMIVKCPACKGKGIIGINICFRCNKEGIIWT
jgi:hypothetical protein